jgi:release factor glutamine methyltransferase
VDGLEALRQIVAGAGRYLRPGGWLALEHGHDQKSALCELLSAAGFYGIRSLRDYGGHDRIILAQFGRS